MRRIAMDFCIRRFLGLAVLGLIMPSGLLASDAWSTYRHDSDRSGVSSETLSLPLSLKWTFRPGATPKPFWPEPAEELPKMHGDRAYFVAAGNGLVTLGTLGDKVYALQADTGAVRWSFYTEGPVRFAPTMWEDKVLVGSDDGKVYALSARDGSLIWSYRPGPSEEKVIGSGRMISRWPIRTGILVEEGVAYFAAGVFPSEGLFLCALNAQEGSVIWKNDAIGEDAHVLSYGGFSPQGYLVASRDMLYLPTGRTLPAVFEKKTGRFVKWLSGGAGGTWIMREENLVIAGCEAECVPKKMSFDENSGEAKGSAYGWFPGKDLVITPQVSYVLTLDGIYAIDRQKYGQMLKELDQSHDLGVQIEGKLADVKKKASGGSKESEAELDRLSQELQVLRSRQEGLKASCTLWKRPSTASFALILSGPNLFVGGDSVVQALDAKSGEELWKSKVDGKAFGLATSEGNLFVSTDKGPVVCFGPAGFLARGKVIRSQDQAKSPPEIVDQGWYAQAADTILRETGISQGFAVVLGSDTGQLALALAKKSSLQVIGIEKDARNLQAARALLESCGLLGTRVSMGDWDLSSLPDFFANLVVSQSMMVSQVQDINPVEAYRILRPAGGVAFLGRPRGKEREAPMDWESWLKRCQGPEPQRVDRNGTWVRLDRPVLEGSGAWTQQYAGPESTGASRDQLVHEPLGVLWYGNPGPEGIVERHARPAAPMSMDGRMFLQGEEFIMAYDAYNGTFLWRRPIPGAVRVRSDVDGGNLALSKDKLFVAAYDRCHALDPKSGEEIRVYVMPDGEDDSPHRWTYVSSVDGLLLGASGQPLPKPYGALWDALVKDGRWMEKDEVPSEFRSTYDLYIDEFKARFPVPDERAKADFHSSGAMWHFMGMGQWPGWGSEKDPQGSMSNSGMLSDKVFALDPDTGTLRWVHQGKKMPHISIAVGEGRVFFTEEWVTPEQTDVALKERKALIAQGVYEEGSEASILPGKSDVRLLVALDVQTGQKLWEKPMELSGCGGGKMGAATRDGILFLFGHFSNHDGNLFKEGSLIWRRITAVSTTDGQVLWSRPLNYLRRPVVLKDKIIIEPRACETKTGQIVMRENPLTGDEAPFEFLRPGHSCGITCGAENAIFYRSYCAAFYDLEKDRGITLFGGVRPGCWLNMIPANGLLLFPESSSGCTCDFSMRCSLALYPRHPAAPGTDTRASSMQSQDEPRPWSVFISNAPQTPVRHMALNLGAPGDARSEQGTLWLGYPRPKSAYGIKFNLNEKILNTQGFFSQDYRSVTVEGSEARWLYSSGCLGLVKCDLPLIDDAWGETPGTYALRMGFSAPATDNPGQRVFDIQAQDQVVVKGLDIVTEAGGTNKALVKSVSGVKVSNLLSLSFIPHLPNPGPAQAPLIHWIEVEREDAPPEQGPVQISRSSVDVAACLARARASLDKGDKTEALKEFHAAFDVGLSTDSMVQALAGMAEVGCVESLGRIKRICRDNAPVLREYKDLDPLVKDGAQKVLLSVARQRSATEPQAGLKLLQCALGTARSLPDRAMITEEMERLGFQVGQQASGQGFITHWRLIGPIPRPLATGASASMDQVCVDEPKVRMDAIYEFSRRSLQWIPYAGESGMVDLQSLMEPNRAVSAYAYAEIMMPQDQEILLKIGSDDGHKCWFNEEMVGRFDGPRGWGADQDSVKIKAHRGTNAVLLKVLQGDGSWAFSVKVTDLNGAPIPGVVFR